MSRINPRLLEQLKRKLGVEQAQVYRLIAPKSQKTFLPPPLAAISLAAENGINISKFASSEDLSTIRQASNSTGASSLVISTTLPTPALAKKPVKKQPKKYPAEKRRGNSVFVVHGRNEKLRKSIFQFLRSIELIPIEWSKAIALTGKGSPHVSEILDAAFREAVAIVVLLSPDDEAKLKAEFLKSSDAAYEKKLTGQARANVLFEAGMALEDFRTKPCWSRLGRSGHLATWQGVM